MSRKNYLDLVPKKNYNWKLKEGSAVVIMPHKGFYAMLAHVLFKVPLKSYISLDEAGTFVWLLIDGKRTLREIVRLVDEKFSQDSDAYVRRTEEYFRILKKNKFICY